MGSSFALGQKGSSLLFWCIKTYRETGKKVGRVLVNGMKHGPWYSRSFVTTYFVGTKDGNPSNVTVPLLPVICLFRY